MNHAIETGWNPRDGSMQAYCRNCRTWFGAWCADATDYVSVRRAECEARAPFADFPCFEDSEELNRGASI